MALIFDSSIKPPAITAIKNTVAGMVGLDPSRGDQITTASVPFTKIPAAGAASAGPLGAPLSIMDIVKYVLGGIGSVVFLFLVRKNLKRREGEARHPEPTWFRDIPATRRLAALEPGLGNDMPAALIQQRQTVQRQAEEIVHQAARARRDAGAAMDERVATAEPAGPAQGRDPARLARLEGRSRGLPAPAERDDRAADGRDGQDAGRRAAVGVGGDGGAGRDPAYARGYIAEGGLRFAREALEQSVGTQRAGEILNRLSVIIEQTPFEFLRNTPPDQIAVFLRNEHPQTLAMVVAQLPTTPLAAKVMELLEAELQADVAMRIAMMGQTSPDVVKEVALVMERKLETVLQREWAAAGGVRSLAAILNAANRSTERNILEHLATEDDEVANEVRSLLFVFEDILKLDDRSIQMVLREVDSRISGSRCAVRPKDAQSKILDNMSQRGAEMLREEMEYMPPQRRRVVEEAQTKIVGVVRKLEDSGELVISRGGDAEDELIG